MDLKWHESGSMEEPILVDDTASDEITIVRRNVHTVEVENMDGTKTTMYKYDEAFPTKLEYQLYKINLDNIEAHTNLELAVAEAVEAML